jgi:glutamate synthase (NADPH/NADH) large chain
MKINDQVLGTQTLYDPENEHDNCGIGFVAHIEGKKSHTIIQQGLQVLENMSHRGAEGADNSSGDGAGITLQILHKLYEKEGIPLPEPGKYGTGLIFMPDDPETVRLLKEMMTVIIEDEGLKVITFRDVPSDEKVLGEIARATKPYITQIFVSAPGFEQDELERKLYIIRKIAENKVRNSELAGKEKFYIVSLSSKVVVYKGMFTPQQLSLFYDDLRNPEAQSAIAMVHSRFSTNTFPTWDLAQPFRMIAHNGEINTIKGNRLWMTTRESLLESDLFRDDLEKVFPVVEPGKSDSASLDNVIEFLTMTGRSIPHALSMMIPESWNAKNPIPNSLKAFYEYHSTFMEPWDGPAAILFTDGRYIGGTLDRNGLRPSRYLITKDKLVVMGSETGVVSFDGADVVEKGRLRPGKILLIDTKLGTIIPNNEVKEELARRHPYANWLEENRLELQDIKVQHRVPSDLGEIYEPYLELFGYSKEDINTIIKYMANVGKEPMGSMGNDAPMAIFSDKPQRLFNYFRQIFAQVTNPAIDPLREGLVMALTNYIGSIEKNLLTETGEHCKLIKFRSPIITNTDLGKIKDLKHESFTNVILPMAFKVKEGTKALEKAIDELCQKAENAVDDGINFIILSDKELKNDEAPIPSLLAVSAVHHHLITRKKRMQTALIVETGEAREVHHFALLIGYGASVVNPYLAFGVIYDLVQKGKIKHDYSLARKNYIESINKGLLKIISKMGISTLRSYFGAQLFEAIGIGNELIEKYFQGTPSKIGGIGLEDIAKDAFKDYEKAYRDDILPVPERHEGIYAFRKNGLRHAWDPEAIGLLQWATSTDNYSKFKEFTRHVDEKTAKPHFVRGLIDFKKNPIPLEEVEPEQEIMKRFVTGAMSFGSISKEAHEAMAIAMNRIGGRSNTGEGGESPERFKPHNGVNKRSSIKQIASGRFGVDAQYLVNADELQIKVAQGAKPGEGGQLPGYKVDKIIAKLRNSLPGITLISPPPHHDIYSIEDLAQLIFDLRTVNPHAKISVKLVSENGVGTVAAGVTKAHADLIVISGSDGGTGASPVSSIKHAGMPWEIGLAETHQTLVLNKLRDRVRLQTDGQIKTGRDVVIGALLGAEEFGVATGALIVLGCVMMRKCHLNTCPVGIATQDKKLRERFRGKADYLVSYFTFLAREVREYMAEMGIRKFDDMVGRFDLLEKVEIPDNEKLKNIDLSRIMKFPVDQDPLTFKQQFSNEKPESKLDKRILKRSVKAIGYKEKVWISEKIQNTDRSTGAELSGEIARIYGKEGLPEDTVNCKFYGSAGQSFGAFLMKGVTFHLEGDANDYLGKGLSGGKIIVNPPAGSSFEPHKNIIAGNTILYGATGGELYVNGMAGERFCVRNSGANAVVEGTGDHGCEYMTGGRVVILGETGRNFAAGMSGGIAYVLDINGDFDYYCNKDMVELSGLNDYDDVRELQEMIAKHLFYTKSPLAEKILTNWETYLPRFVKVMPLEYKKVLNEQKIKEINKKLKIVEQNIEFE